MRTWIFIVVKMFLCIFSSTVYASCLITSLEVEAVSFIFIFFLIVFCRCNIRVTNSFTYGVLHLLLSASKIRNDAVSGVMKREWNLKEGCCFYYIDFSRLSSQKIRNKYFRNPTLSDMLAESSDIH